MTTTADWQPMETAPKNTPILIALTDKETGRFWGLWILSVTTGSAILIDGVWKPLILQDGMSMVDWDREYAAVSWQPLPAPPQS